ncbi:MAG: peptide chain release factor aRF-1 [Candidatus Bathyarchaeota archaeon]|nr:peptide chain release factor aRF-1 [Candidatus Bathyarchaeota archaeon]
MADKISHFYGCQITTSYSAKQHKLRKLIAYLSDKTAPDKEYISLYLPANTPLEAALANLKANQATLQAGSERANSRLKDALKNLIQNLKLHSGVPTDGLVMFAGTFADEGGNAVLHMEELVPPSPVGAFLFAMDRVFLLEPLRDMLRDQRIVGFLALDAKQATLAMRRGDNLQMLESLTSGVAGKTGKGGQSQRRYERERDMQLTAYFHRVAEHAAKAFFEEQKATTLIVGGPGATKNEFLKGDFLHYELKNALLNVVDTQSACEDGVFEMMAKSSEALDSMCGPQEKKSMQRLETELSKENGLAAVGLDAVLEGLQRGEVEVALVTDNSDLVEINAVCKKCGLPKAKIVRKRDPTALQAFLGEPCVKCRGGEWEVVERDLVDVLEDAAVQTDARVEVVFTGSEEKARLSALGGVAALLRYRVG